MSVICQNIFTKKVVLFLPEYVFFCFYKYQLTDFSKRQIFFKLDAASEKSFVSEFTGRDFYPQSIDNKRGESLCPKAILPDWLCGIG
jgi:hypothetical protein